MKNTFKSNLTFTIDISSIKEEQEFFEIVHTDTDSPLNKLRQKTLGSSMTKMNLTVKDIQRDFTLPYESFV